MKIDGWDVALECARQHTAKYGNSSIENRSEWPPGGLTPALLNGEFGFQELEVALTVKGHGRAEILGHVGRILSRLRGPVELELDGNSHRFRGVLEEYSRKETSMNRWHSLTLTFRCYEFSGLVVRRSAGRAEFTADNPGSAVTPAVVEVTPGDGCASAVLHGLCRDPMTGEPTQIRLSGLEAGKTVVLDGETGLVTQDGALKAGDAEFWDVPSLLPGENRIRAEGGQMDITLKYRPRYI